MWPVNKHFVILKKKEQNNNNSNNKKTNNILLQIVEISTALFKIQNSYLNIFDKWSIKNMKIIGMELEENPPIENTHKHYCGPFFDENHLSIIDDEKKGVSFHFSIHIKYQLIFRLENVLFFISFKNTKKYSFFETEIMKQWKWKMCGKFVSFCRFTFIKLIRWLLL